MSIDFINYWNQVFTWIETLDPSVKDKSYSFKLFDKNCKSYPDCLGLESLDLFNSTLLCKDIYEIFEGLKTKDKNDYTSMINTIKDLKISKYYGDETPLKKIYITRIEKLIKKKLVDIKIEDLHKLFFEEVTNNFNEIINVYKKYLSEEAISIFKNDMDEILESFKLEPNFFEIALDEYDSKDINCFTFLCNKELITFNVNNKKIFKILEFEAPSIEVNMFITLPNDIFWCTLNYNDYNEHDYVFKNGCDILFHNIFHRFTYFHECGHNFSDFNSIILKNVSYNCLSHICKKLTEEECKFNNFLAHKVYSQIDTGIKEQRNAVVIRDILADILAIHFIKNDLNIYYRKQNNFATYATYCVINQIFKHLGVYGDYNHFSPIARFILICYTFPDLKYLFELHYRQKIGGFFNKYLKYKIKYINLKNKLLSPS